MNLLLSVLLLQSADETFKRIEESLDRAKSVEVVFKGEVAAAGGGKEEKLAYSGAVRSLGEKMSLTFKMARDGREHEIKTVVDGATMRVIDGPRVQEKEAPKNFRANLNVMIGRSGMYLAMMMGRPPLKPGEKEPDPKGLFRVSEVKIAEEGVLTYRMNLDGPTEVVDAKIWYDPKTFKLLKRTIGVKVGNETLSLTELYEGYTLNGDIPQEKLK
jgi:hypothetical protein